MKVCLNCSAQFVTVTYVKTSCNHPPTSDEDKEGGDYPDDIFR